MKSNCFCDEIFNLLANDFFFFLFDIFHVWLSFLSIEIIFKVYTVTIFRLYLTGLLKQGISAGKLLARERKRISGCRSSLR